MTSDGKNKLNRGRLRARFRPDIPEGAEEPAGPHPSSADRLVPHFVLVGSGEALTYMGQLDFFLRECPKGMKTMSTALFLSTLSLGFFVSSVLVSIVHRVSGAHTPWLADDLDHGRLYNFYRLLAVLSTLNLVVFWVNATWYVYKDKRLAAA